MPVLVPDDPRVIERAMDNPLLKWMAAFFGRLNNAEWAEYGLESPFPGDWHYSLKLIPIRLTAQAYVDPILRRVTRPVAESTFLHGNAAQVAAQIQGFIDAGSTHVDVQDVLPLVLDPADAQAGLGRQLQVCGLIRQRNPK